MTKVIMINTSLHWQKDKTKTRKQNSTYHPNSLKSMLEYEEAVECRASSLPLALTLLKKIIIKIVSNL